MKFRKYLLPSARFDVESLFRKIRILKTRIFVNFDLDLDFRGLSVEEFDGRSQSARFAENLMKTG